MQSIFRRRIPKHEALEVVKFGIKIDSYCEYCGLPAGWDTFKTHRNRIEYNLSGHCQTCQDSIIDGSPGIIPSHWLPKKARRAAGFKTFGKRG